MNGKKEEIREEVRKNTDSKHPINQINTNKCKYTNMPSIALHTKRIVVLLT